MVSDASLSAERITFGGHTTNTWHAILQEAAKTGQIAALLAVALREYGSNQSLQVAAAFYSDADNTSREATDIPLSRVPPELVERPVAERVPLGCEAPLTSIGSQFPLANF